MSRKPLGHRAYGSIGHLPSSRLGPGDHSVHEGQARICTERIRDRLDTVIVQEKLDGSCCSVARLEDGRVVALGRAGYPATTSRFRQHHLFAAWVRERLLLFEAILRPGERFVGEWMAQAHGTKYDPSHRAWAPFVVFDLMVGHNRAVYAELIARVNGSELVTASPLHIGGAFSLEDAQAAIQQSHHGALEDVEGVVYRVERGRSVDFLAKWVRQDKVDGKYLPDVDNFCGETHWHWEGRDA